MARRMTEAGHKVAYAAAAPVFHHHQESWAQVRRRFEREALALRQIMPEVHLSRSDVVRCVLTSTLADWRSAARNGITSTSRRDMAIAESREESGIGMIESGIGAPSASH